ncbi:HIT domain-containing protein [Mongoliitalea daihaiensis]|nr:HIT domain-containing protein [Mongoliitalea daihaiensis]
MQVMKNEFSHLTAKERDKISFPARLLEERGLLKGRILDFGCGYGRDVEVLQSKGYQIEGYDKHYAPTYPQGKFDTVICLYVLNVLHLEEQTKVLIEISKLLQPLGKAFFAVRRDLTYQGYRTHKIHQKPTYQCNVILPYQSVFLNDSCEIYAYTPINQLSRSSDMECIFCNPTPQMELIAESASVFAIYDKFPVNQGHALIIPKRHVDNYFELTLREQTAINFMLNEVKQEIQEKLNPAGFNVGINVGKVAGQSINHVHIHLIPRYEGDVEDPFGGVRGVIPSKRKY